MSEKEYLSRSGSLDWELVKPFSPVATDTLAESTHLIHDFAVAVAALDVTANHLILDVGSGPSWTSEWLRRLNLRVVSFDIALEMLNVARTRCQGASPALVNGDMEALPFPAAAFDRVLCLNALHHVPNPALALREIARVLTDRGRLVLIEPGRGHSQTATSHAAIHEFGVLEQELEALTLMRLCADAGFSNVTARPLSYASGEIEVDLDQLSRWRKWTRTKRPLRAITKLRRGLLELVGLGKQGPLLEDALSVWTSRVLMRHMAEQPVVVASKHAYEPAVSELRAAIQQRGRTLITDGALRCELSLKNVGSALWRANGSRRIEIGLQRADGNQVVLQRDWIRVPLPRDVDPGQECTVQVDVAAAGVRAGDLIRVDLVAEGVTWFESVGSSPLILRTPLDSGRPLY